MALDCLRLSVDAAKHGDRETEHRAEDAWKSAATGARDEQWEVRRASAGVVGSLLVAFPTNVAEMLSRESVRHALNPRGS